MVEEPNCLVFGEEIHAEYMFQNPGALVEKQLRSPHEQLVDGTFNRPVVEIFVPNNIKQMKAENQHEEQPHVEIRLVALVSVKLFYFVSI